MPSKILLKQLSLFVLALLVIHNLIGFVAGFILSFSTENITWQDEMPSIAIGLLNYLATFIYFFVLRLWKKCSFLMLLAVGLTSVVASTVINPIFGVSGTPEGFLYAALMVTILACIVSYVMRTISDITKWRLDRKRVKSQSNEENNHETVDSDSDSSDQKTNGSLLAYLLWIVHSFLLALTAYIFKIGSAEIGALAYAFGQAVGLVVGANILALIVALIAYFSAKEFKWRLMRKTQFGLTAFVAISSALLVAS